jgi:hypothetical protein
MLIIEFDVEIHQHYHNEVNWRMRTGDCHFQKLEVPSLFLRMHQSPMTDFHLAVLLLRLDSPLSLHPLSGNPLSWNQNLIDNMRLLQSRPAVIRGFSVCFQPSKSAGDSTDLFHPTDQFSSFRKNVPAVQSRLDEFGHFGRENGSGQSLGRQVGDFRSIQRIVSLATHRNLRFNALETESQVRNIFARLKIISGFHCLSRGDSIEWSILRSREHRESRRNQSGWQFWWRWNQFGW